MVQNGKSKKEKQAEKAPSVNNDSEQSQIVKNAPSRNHSENEIEIGEQNSIAEPESSSNGAMSAIKQLNLLLNLLLKKASESAAENESTKTTVSERGEEKSSVPQSKTKGRPRKDKRIEMDTVEPTADEPGSSGDTQTKENEDPSERTVTHKRKAYSPVEEHDSEEAVVTESAETTAPSKKSRRKEVTAKDKKEKSAETSCRRVDTAKEEPSEVEFHFDELCTTCSPNSRSLSSTPVSRPRASYQESDFFSALNNLASVLAKIESRLTAIEKNQQEILQKIRPNHSTSLLELPSEIELPCDSIEDVNKLEEWLKSEDNVKALIVNLSILGWKTSSNAVRRILEKLFSNKVAVNYNWTGKHQKHPLKDLRVTKIIPGIVRRSIHTANVTDAEVYSILSNWFRFCKDRDGGRKLRRSMANTTRDM